MTPTTSIPKIATVRVLVNDPAQAYARNLRAALKAAEAAAAHNPDLLAAVRVLLVAENARLVAERQAQAFATSARKGVN